jgi:hypothetical protein
MTKQIASIVKATLLVGAGLFIPGLSGLPAGAAAECLLAPSGLSPQGQHWYYRFDRINQRKCWYLRAPTQAVRRAEPNVTPSVEPPAEPLPVLRKESAVTTPAAPPPLERPAWPAPRIDANQEADATPWVERGPLQTNNSDSRGVTPTLSSPRPARANDAPDNTLLNQQKIEKPAADESHTGTITPMRLALLAAGILLVPGILLRTTFKFVSSSRRRKLHRNEEDFASRSDESERSRADSRVAPPTAAAAILDMKNIAALDPVNRPVEAEQILLGILRDLERDGLARALSR